MARALVVASVTVIYEGTDVLADKSELFVMKWRSLALTDAGKVNALLHVSSQGSFLIHIHSDLQI